MRLSGYLSGRYKDHGARHTTFGPNAELMPPRSRLMNENVYRELYGHSS